MFLYGLAKAIPLQMPFPFLTRLLEPYGNFSPMAVLWSSVGASPSYEIFAGCAETLGGILLLPPRTTTLGALVCLADMIQVFTLNMTYDVPVKLFSFHLILFSLFLLAPEANRLIGFFFTDRTIGPSRQIPLFRSVRANRVAVALQVAFGLYLIGMGIYSGIQGWHTYGGGRTKSSLYGIWNVEQMSVDGQVRPALLTDQDRWRRVVFDFPTFTSFQRPDDTFTGYSSTIGEKDSTLTLTKAADKNWKASFTYARPAPDQLVLNGSHGWPSGANEVEAFGSRQIYAGQSRLPLDQRIPISALKGRSFRRSARDHRRRYHALSVFDRVLQSRGGVPDPPASVILRKRYS